MDDIAMYLTNPQFFVTLCNPDPRSREERCHLLVSLSQSTVGRRRDEIHSIGVMIFRRRGYKNKAKLVEADLMELVAESQQFLNLNEVCLHTILKRGHYIIVPSTFKSNKEASFTMRVFLERE